MLLSKTTMFCTSQKIQTSHILSTERCFGGVAAKSYPQGSAPREKSIVLAQRWANPTMPPPQTERASQKDTHFSLFPSSPTTEQQMVCPPQRSSVRPPAPARLSPPPPSSLSSSFSSSLSSSLSSLSSLSSRSSPSSLSSLSSLLLFHLLLASSSPLHLSPSLSLSSSSFFLFALPPSLSSFRFSSYPFFSCQPSFLLSSSSGSPTSSSASSTSILLLLLIPLLASSSVFFCHFGLWPRLFGYPRACH